MLRSLFAGISGLRVNQTMLDVTGNNIANANTTGFKSSSTVFQDTLSQMLTAGTAGNAQRGGTNPIQIGLGVQVAATSGNFNQGANQTTNSPTDMMINGDGFFVVQQGTTLNYTRAGAFHWDPAGNLTAPDGKFVMGLDATGNLVKINLNNPVQAPPVTTPPTELVSYEIGSDGVVTGMYSDDQRRTIGQVAIADFVNPQGLNKVGDTQFAATSASGSVTYGAPGTGRMGTLTVGSLEMSNVDLAQEFTNLILAQRGFEASSKVITTSDQVLEDLVNIKR
ncbi:flagellar hook-basal body complex protein [Nocardioides sp. CER19]|uniref:flagellar hook-basal body complex protein n=1 Tax=Nocardioides sp. CER19 TaxID=3038538 RepID=UPI0024484B42|nr:flagellar hook-basal body complex protein [Nocardioides sp. CER19]MDH2414623.1 flagellar hook-basal body complex protein [Nocardioides sp. CER19]